MTSITTESGRTYDGFDVVVRILEADNLERHADDLRRRGGGFTATVEAILRAKVAKFRDEANWIDALLAEAEAR